MARIAEPQSKKDRPHISHNEMDDLKRNIAAFKGNKNVNGLLIGPYEQWLCSVGIRKVSDDGSWICLQPEPDMRYGHINAALELREHYRYMEYAQSNSEIAAELQAQERKVFQTACYTSPWLIRRQAVLQNVKHCEDVSCGKLLLPGERYLEYKGRCFCHFACLQRATMLNFRIDEVIRKNAPPHKESTTRIGNDPLPPDYRGGFFLRRAFMNALRFGNLCYHRFILASPFARGRRD